jgi:hypothetical protein
MNVFSERRYVSGSGLRPTQILTQIFVSFANFCSNSLASFCKSRRAVYSVSDSFVETNMNLSRTTLKKAYPYLGICEFCGGILELSYYDFVLECAVCEECAGDLAAGENALAAVGIASPGPEYFDGSGS